MAHPLLAIALFFAGTLAGGPAWLWASSYAGEGGAPVSRQKACLASGLMWCGVALAFGPSVETVQLCLLCLVLVALSVSDLSALVIPDACILAAVAIRLGFVASCGALGIADPMQLAASSLVGSACALLPLLILTMVIDHVLGIESMGGGDLKLLAVAGAYVGWRLLPFVLALSCLMGLAGAAVHARGRPDALEPFAFGPAIAFALWVTLLASRPMEAWFVRWVF